MPSPLSFRRGDVLIALIGLFTLSLVGTANAQNAPLSPTERGKLDGELQLLLDRETETKPGTVGQEEVVLPSMKTITVQQEGTMRYSVIVHTDDPAALQQSGIFPNSVFDGFVTARVTSDQLRTLAQTATVSRIESSTTLKPTNDEAASEVGARTLNAGAVNNTNYKGQGVITCVIDSGIDYDHGDFYRSDGTTRILRIWDQSVLRARIPRVYSLTRRLDRSERPVEARRLFRASRPPGPDALKSDSQ